MRIFLAGASGVLGIRLLLLLVAAGHSVVAMTRSPDRTAKLAELGAEPVVCDVYDADALRDALVAARPDAVLHQLTDLADRADQIAEYRSRNARIRTEGTRNLLAAARAAGAEHVLAQSIAWTPQGVGDSTEQHERQVLDAGGVVVRYGQLYGPGTYYPTEPPDHPRVHVDDAARRTVPLITAPSGIVVVTEC
jgi:nucleoside-diphosphate-sugar epimerase